MSGNIFDQLKEAARQKAKELDEKLDITGKVESVKAKVEKIDEEYKVSDKVKGAASKTESTVREGADEIFGTAQKYYTRAEKAYNFGAGAAKAGDAVMSGYEKARVWMKENPGKATVVSLSMVAGIRAAEILPALNVTLLGGAGLIHSALPIIGLRKLTEKYDEYLKNQEKLIAEGKLDDAERSRVEFQRNMTKYVGAPLLGAFSIAAGATLIGASLSGATVTGLPLSLILGGNPLLNGIWFFANGVICISEGYKFFMIALANEEEVHKVIREIKGLLPA